jgi:hypothetical protein
LAGTSPALLQRHCELLFLCDVATTMSCRFWIVLKCVFHRYDEEKPTLVKPDAKKVVALQVPRGKPPTPAVADVVVVQYQVVFLFDNK